MAHELARQEEYYHYYYLDRQYCGDDHDREQGDHGQSSSTVDDDHDLLMRDDPHQTQQLGATVLASKFAVNTRKSANVSQKPTGLKPDAMPNKLFKPEGGGR